MPGASTTKIRSCAPAPARPESRAGSWSTAWPGWMVRQAWSVAGAALECSCRDEQETQGVPPPSAPHDRALPVRWRRIGGGDAAIAMARKGAAVAEAWFFLISVRGATSRGGLGCAGFHPAAGLLRIGTGWPQAAETGRLIIQPATTYIRLLFRDARCGQSGPLRRHPSPAISRATLANCALSRICWSRENQSGQYGPRIGNEKTAESARPQRATRASLGLPCLRPARQISSVSIGLLTAGLWCLNRRALLELAQLRGLRYSLSRVDKRV
jgi:hypothetical protein